MTETFIPTEAPHDINITIDGKRIAGIVKEIAAKTITHEQGDKVLELFGEELRDDLTLALRDFVADHFGVRHFGILHRPQK